MKKFNWTWITEQALIWCTILSFMTGFLGPEPYGSWCRQHFFSIVICLLAYLAGKYEPTK